MRWWRGREGPPAWYSEPVLKRVPVYKDEEVLKRNVDTANAVEELINLLSDNDAQV